jgi:hypothetical protein
MTDSENEKNANKLVKLAQTFCKSDEGDAVTILVWASIKAAQTRLTPTQLMELVALAIGVEMGMNSEQVRTFADHLSSVANSIIDKFGNLQELIAQA